jgi:hypothetical protein
MAFVQEPGRKNMFGSIISYRTRVPSYGWKFWKRFTNYSWLQNTFTNRPETHCAIYVGTLHRLDIEMVFDAAASVRYDEFSFNSEAHTIFQIGTSDRILKEVIDSLRRDYLDKIYGVFQLPYFVLRWAFGWAFDVRRWWFPLRTGKICSELCYEYLYRVAGKMNWRDLTKYLEQWHPDNFHAGDCRQVLDKFTGIYFNKIKGY